MTEERLTRLEEQLAITGANVRTMARYFRQGATREAQADAARMDALLAPRPLAEGRAGTLPAVPDLGSPLIDRLAGDSALSHSVAGSSLAALSSGNLLYDPTFSWTRDVAGITPTGPGVTTEFGYWKAKAILVSGTAPTVSFDKVQSRRFYSGLALKVGALWGSASAGVVRVELRSAPIGGSGVSPLAVAWPWLVGAIRAAGRVDGSAWGGVDVSVVLRVMDWWGTTTVAESDPIDIAVFDAVKMEARPFASYVDPDEADYVLGVDITFDYDGTDVADKSNHVHLAEPQLNLTDEESPPLYQPAIGRYDPLPDAIGVRLVRDIDQSIPHQEWTAINFGDADMEQLDTHEMHDPTYALGQRVEIHANGVYSARAQARFASAGGDVRAVRIMRDPAAGGTHIEMARTQTPPCIGAPWQATAADDVYCTAGDELYAEVWQDSGGALDIVGDATHAYTSLSVRLVAWYNDEISPPPDKPGR